MIRFFFYRSGMMVRIMEFVGLIGFAVIIRHFLLDKLTYWQSAFVFITIIEYLFLRYCALWRWHQTSNSSLGIRLQFQKAMVPTSYIMAIASLFFLGTQNIIFLIIAPILLAVVAHVNVILIFLYMKDSKKTCINTYGTH